MAPAAQGWGEPHQLGAPALGGFQVLAGNDAVLEDALLAIHVGEEVINRFQALEQAALQFLPLTGANQSRQGIKGQDALATLMAGIVEAKGGAQALQ